MSRVKLPAFLEEMPSGPHKRDEIRRYKKLLKKKRSGTMANPENLIPNENRTPMERRANAQKAGIASGKARREKRDRHKRIQELFALAVQDPKLKANLEKMGIDVTNADLETAADARVMVELLRKGDYKAWQAMKQEAYGPLATKNEVELSGEVTGITINVKKYGKEEK